jgi:hypothetical protein
MPKAKLNKSQTMTIGAKELASFVVPNGCMKNRTRRMAQDTPTTVPLLISGFTILIPWMAPSTDYAGVRTPSDMISATPRTPTVLRKTWARPLLSMKFLADLALRRSSPVCTLSILTIDSSRGSLLTILACIFVRRLALENWNRICGRANLHVAKESEQGKSSTFSLVICSKNDEDVFDANHQGQSPDDKREGTQNVIIGGIGGKVDE